MSKTANRGAGALSRFAHFAGITKTKAEEPATTEDVKDVKDDVEDVEDDVEDLEDRVDDLEEQVEDTTDEEEDDKDAPAADKPAERAAYLRGRASGRKAERSRAGAILAAPVASKNRNLALHLAFESAMPAKQAVALLKAGAVGAAAQSPAAAPTSARKGATLDTRMESTKPVNVGSGASANGPDMSTASGVAAHVLAVAKRAGIVK